MGRLIFATVISGLEVTPPLLKRGCGKGLVSGAKWAEGYRIAVGGWGIVAMVPGREPEVAPPMVVSDVIAVWLPLSWASVPPAW